MTLERANVRGVWAFDEGRFRLRVGLHKRWCPCGVRPPCLVHDRSQWLWLYPAVEPATGRSLFLLLPRVTKEGFAAFLAACAAATTGERVGLIHDGSGSRRASIPRPAHVVPPPLPPYSPDLNPAEQRVRVLRPTLANRIFATLGELERELTEQPQRFWDQPSALKRLTGYP